MLGFSSEWLPRPGDHAVTATTPNQPDWFVAHDALLSGIHAVQSSPSPPAKWSVEAGTELQRVRRILAVFSQYQGCHLL